MCIIKNSKNKIAKHFKLYLSGTVEKNSHNTIQWLNCVIQYLNIKIKENGLRWLT